MRLAGKVQVIMELFNTILINGAHISLLSTRDLTGMLLYVVGFLVFRLLIASAISI